MTNVSQRMLNLGTARSEIREAFAFAQARAAEVGAENVDDFSIGNPSVPAPATVAEAVHKLVDAIDPIKLHGYTPAQGDGQARGALADDLNRRFGTNYTADNFYLTAGAAGALCCALSALSCPGDTFITFAPYFPEYKVFVESAGAELVTVPADIEDFQIDFAAFDQALTPNTKGVIINSPNNPTGVVYSEATIQKLAQVLTEKSKEYGHTIWLISDEPYREIVYRDTPLPWVPNYYPNTLVCYSYSKSLSLPGQRIGYVLVPPQAEDADIVYAAVCGAGRALGYVCAPKPIIQCLTKLHQFGIMSAPTVSQYAAIEAMRNGDGDIEHMREEYDSRRRYLVENLNRIGLTCFEPRGAFYVFPCIRSTGLTSEEFCERFLMEEKVAVIAGNAFGEGGEGFVRCCYATSMKDIAEALTRMDNFLTNLKKKQARA